MASVPWPELRRIIQERLSQVVEQLSQAKPEDGEHQYETNVATIQPAEPAEKRKRNEIDDEDAESASIDTACESAIAKAHQAHQAHTNDEQDEPMKDSTDDRSTSEESQTPAAQTTSSTSLARETNGHTCERDIRDLEDRISYSLHTFDDAPFTIQRIAELLAWPDRHYRNVLKFLRAVERVVYVTSTVDEFPPCGLKDSGPKESMDAHVTATPSSMFSLAMQKNEGGSGLTVRNEAGSRQRDNDTPRWAEPGIPPLDASDTGIVHIASTDDDKDALRSRIQNVADSDVPVCIDEPDSTSGKVTVVPVYPAAPSNDSTTES
ncbi:hypothetical protein GGH12_001211 [Coemansia sp. RSA 1822]|nr:hypothetical protein GGF49_001449 [Coemansia sp. RSA 1853]KAJ2565778.1 hypothetical protein GGH12_001211 [Coemansia sp. RSA 1822]